jgi:biotin carboxylase
LKKLILLATAFSYRVSAFEQAAESLGIPVVRGEDVPPPLIGKTDAPLALDYRDIPRSAALIEDYANETPVGAIIGLDDSGTLIASQAAARIGLPVNDPTASLAARSKAVMREHFARAGVPSPKFQRYTLDEDPAHIAAGLTYPCVLKPTTMSGSRGVMRADNEEEFLLRYQKLRKLLVETRCDEFLVEDFIPGVEVALEGLLDNGKLLVLALFDKPDPLDGPYFEETIYVTPSRLPEERQQEIADVVAQAAAALGLRHGPVHAELRLPPGKKPVMVEVAARSIGGSCGRTLRFSGKTSLEEVILRQAFGLPFSSEREAEAGGVMMIPIPEGGILRKVTGVEEAQAVPLIEEIEITAPMHQKVVPLPEGDSYLGFIFARGESPEVVEAALRQAHQKLDFSIVPDLPIISFTNL